MGMNYRPTNIEVNRDANSRLLHNLDVKRTTQDTPGERIRAMRETKGMNQTQLAKKAGIEQPSLSQIETGDTRTLRGKTLMGLAKALEVNPQWILTGRDSLVEPQTLTVEETELLALYRTLDTVDAERIISFARTMSLSKTTPPSRVNPYSKAKSHS